MPNRDAFRHAHQTPLPFQTIPRNGDDGGFFIDDQHVWDRDPQCYWGNS